MTTAETLLCEHRESLVYFAALVVEAHDRIGNLTPDSETFKLLTLISEQLFQHRDKRRGLADSAKLIDMIDSCVDLLTEVNQLALFAEKGYISPDGIPTLDVIVDKLRRWGLSRGYRLTEEQAKELLQSRVRNGSKGGSVRERVVDGVGRLLDMSQSAVQQRSAARKKVITARNAIRTPEQYERAFADRLPGRGRIVAEMMRALGYGRREIIKAQVAASHSHVGLATELGERLAAARRWRHRPWRGMRRPFRRRRFTIHR